MILDIIMIVRDALNLSVVTVTLKVSVISSLTLTFDSTLRLFTLTSSEQTVKI